jgi:dTDP-4-amino-4,6-dideoxygalactose transaminase
MNKNTIPMLDLKAEYQYMKTDIDAAIARCLEHQQWIFGPEVKECEDRFAEYIGVKHCIGVSSGTDALVLALRALAIKTKGQEYFDRSDFIITTPFTFTATGDAILRAGATPLFIDIDPITYNIDPYLIRSCLEIFPHSLSPIAHSPSRVVGILPVHLYGQSCQMDEIMFIADEYKLFVVEDVAQAFGASWNGKKLGSIGTVGAFSFFPSKNLGAFGDAGMVSTNTDEIADMIRMLIKHGGKDKYNVDHIGYNARLDTLQAAVLLAKLKYLDEFIARRQSLALLHEKGLRGLDGIIPPLTHSPSLIASDSSLLASGIHSSMPLCSGYHIFHQFTIRVLNGKRDALQRHLRQSRVDSMVYYPIPLHKMNVFGGMCIVLDALSNVEEAARSVLSLPIEPLYNEENILHVVNHVKEFFA